MGRRPLLLWALGCGLAAAGLVAGCGAVQDEARAEAVVAAYYAAFKAGDYEKAAAFYAPSFFEQTPQGEWKSALRALNAKLGDLRDYRLVSVHADVRLGAGPDAGTFYTLQYDVTNTRYPSMETFVLQKMPDASFKIVSQHGESQGLLQ